MQLVCGSSGHWGAAVVFNLGFKEAVLEHFRVQKVVGPKVAKSTFTLLFQTEGSSS